MNFFNKVEKISLITLFYTGKKEYSFDLFKVNISEKIDFFQICSVIKVESCPYGLDYKDKCTVYSNKLDNVYEFYSRDKRNKK